MWRLFFATFPPSLKTEAVYTPGFAGRSVRSSGLRRAAKSHGWCEQRGTKHDELRGDIQKGVRNVRPVHRAAFQFTGAIRQLI